MNECEIFMAAIDIASPVRRSAFLDRACGRNRMLRRRIEALLTSYSKAGSLLEDPPIGRRATPHVNRIEERSGTMVGPYKLMTAIGEGGMGVVFVAEQIQPVRRTVALKIIKPGLVSRQVKARFEAEQQALARMKHPNIAHVLDAGTTERDRYFVMELVDGAPITEFCDAHRLPLRVRLELFVQICQGVRHAHQKGIIHRDLKPSNVLVTLCDGQPVPKIIDFGVAKATGPKLTEATLVTELGQVVGTLEYMSPEQAELSQPDVDTRSDIYSLGVLLYELLTGTTPLERGRLRITSLLDGLRLVREEEPQRPSSRLMVTEDLTAIAADRGLEPNKLYGVVRGELDWIAMKCLEKNRDRRYETAGGLASDIQHYLRDEPVAACPPSTVYRIRKFARKHWSAIAVTGGIAALLIVGVIVSTSLAIRASNALAQAKMNEQRALEKEQEALASAEKARRAADAEQQARRAAEVERKAREKETIQRHLAQERAEAVSDFLTKTFRNPELSRDSRIADALARSAGEVKDKFDDASTKTYLLTVLAESNYGLGFYREAVPLWEKVRDDMVKALGPDNPTTLAASGNLAVAYKQTGRMDEARQLFEETLERLQGTVGPDDAHTRITITHLSDVYRKIGKFDEAVPLAEEGYTRAMAKLGPDHPETLWAERNLAKSYVAVSRLDDALRLYEERVDRVTATLGPDHSDTIAARHKLAERCARHGMFDDAASEFARLFQRKPHDHGVALRAALHSLAAGDHKSYEAVCRQMLDRYSRTEDGFAANRTSLACLMSSRPVGDVQQLVRLADLAVAAFDDDDAKLADRVITCRTRGLAAYRAGDFKGAVEWCQKSRAMESKRTDSLSFLATDLVIEAMAMGQQGKPAEAKAAYDESVRMIKEHFPDAPVDLGADWFNWLMHELLRREAAELLDLDDAAGADQAGGNRDAATSARGVIADD